MIRYNVDNAVGFKKDRYNVKLPFTMECTDIQQRLINENGSIDVTNTLDWRTQLKIDDPQYGVSIEDASLNKPLFYRGYRFFQVRLYRSATRRNDHARTDTGRRRQRDKSRYSEKRLDNACRRHKGRVHRLSA